jgi:hypothetical protein
MLKFMRWLPVAVVLPILIGAVSVKPEDVASNASQWLRIIGLSDPRVKFGLCIGLLTYCFIAWGLRPSLFGSTRQATLAILSMVASAAVVPPLAQYFLFPSINPVVDNARRERPLTQSESDPSPPVDPSVAPPRRPPRKKRIVTPTQGAGTTPPFGGVTEFDGFSNKELREAVSKRMKELRSFEQGYDERKRSAVSSGSKKASFVEMSKQKEAIELEEEQEFKKYIPEVRAMYNSLLKRRKEPYLGCNMMELATLICGTLPSSIEKPITEAADYFDELAEDLP